MLLFRKIYIIWLHTDAPYRALLPLQYPWRENLTMHFPQIVLNYCDLYISLMQYHWPWLNIYFVCRFREGNYAWISKLALACTPHCQNSNWNLYLDSFWSYNVCSLIRSWVQ